jgi:hypothetical protein
MSLPRYNVSKWIKHQVLLDDDEMRALFAHLGSFFLYNVSEVVADSQIFQDQFLKRYTAYIASLKNGQLIEARRDFSPVLSTVAEALHSHEVKTGYFLTKPCLPVIQLQLHHFLPSTADGKFYPMVLSQESISWGLQFSYPQIFQNQHTQTYAKVDATFPNTALFSKLTKWLREFSAPTTFLWNNVKTSTPIRLGKKCFSWINTHPQLLSKGVSVHVYGGQSVS